MAKWWRRIVCWFLGHQWTEPVDLGAVEISGGALTVHHYRDQKVLRVGHTTIMIRLSVCCRCNATALDTKTNLPIVAEEQHG